MISFREYFLGEQDDSSSINPHSLKKGDKVELTIDGKAMEFQVVNKQQARGSGAVAGGGDGTGYYLELEPVENYGQATSISPADGNKIITYAPVGDGAGSRINVPLDIIINKINAGEGKISFKSDVAQQSGPAGAPQQQGYGTGQARPDADTDAWKGPVGAAQKYGHDLIASKGMQANAQSMLGARIGKWGDKVMHQAIGIPTKEPTGPSVYADGGPGGEAHGQRAKVGHEDLDAVQDTRHPSRQGWGQ